MVQNNFPFPLVQIGSICDLVSSGGTPSRNMPDYFCDNNTGHPWVKSKELLDRSISDTEEHITDLGLNNSSAKYYPANTVLMAMYGANVGQLGWLRKPATVNQAVCGMIINRNVADYRYVFYTLLDKRSDIIVQARGAAQQNLNQDIIRTFEIPIPRLDIQRKVSSILSSFDDLIENNTRRIKLLKEMAQTIYQEWFVHYRFPGYENIRFVDSGTEIGEVPEGWEVKRLNQVSRNYDSKRIPLSSMKRVEMQGIYPYYGAAKVLDYINDYIFDGKYLLIAEDGSVITTDGKPVLQIAYGKFWVNNHTHVLQGIDLVSTEYLYFRLSNLSISGYITGAAQPKITQENLNRILVNIPSTCVLEEFNRIVVPLLDQCDILHRQNSNLQETRNIMLPKMISGELDVSELDNLLG